MLYLLDSVPSPLGDKTSGSQLLAFSNIFLIMGTMDLEMFLDRLSGCITAGVVGEESPNRCASTSKNLASTSLNNLFSLSVSSFSGEGGWSLVSGFRGLLGSSAGL